MTDQRPEARLWIKIDLGRRGQIGPGKITLLRHIHHHRSIAAAARAMAMSYRRAWLLVDELNGLFGRPVIVTRTGGRDHGGAALTPLGEALIARYQTIVAEAEAAAQRELAALAEAVRPPPADG